VKIGCTGDLHLGGGKDYGIAPYGPGSRLEDQERVWISACELFVEQGCELVAFVGDAWQGAKPSPAEILAFQRGLDLLFKAKIPVVAIRGNHDIEAFDRPSALEILLERGVGVFVLPDIIRRRDLALCFLPWVSPGHYVAQHPEWPREEINERIAELLLETAKGLRAEAGDVERAVLFCHWTIQGATLSTGLPTSELREPILPLNDLVGLGFDFVVAGHIHKPQALHYTPDVVYVGSPLVCNFGEAEHEHGVWILDTDDGLYFHALEDRPFVTLDYSIEAWQEILAGEELAGIEGSIVRVRYAGTEEEARRLAPDAIRRHLLELGAHRVYSIQADIDRSLRARVGTLDETISPVQALGVWLEAQADYDAERRVLGSVTADELAERTRAYLAKAEAAS
jgi:DNA repair exonuclease SbcCD nuclease subunit